MPESIKKSIVLWNTIDDHLWLSDGVTMHRVGAGPAICVTCASTFQNQVALQQYFLVICTKVVLVQIVNFITNNASCTKYFFRFILRDFKKFLKSAPG